MTEIRIVDAEQSQLRQIAECHRRAFPTSLSSAMGLSYVVNMLSWYLSTPRCFLFFMELDGRCIGYCGGMVVDGRGEGSASGMLQHSFRAAVTSLLFRPWLLFHPELIGKFRFVLKNIYRRVFRKSAVVVRRKVVEHVGLVVIGIDPSFQGRGFSGQLLSRFEDKSRERGQRRMMLTVLSSNTKAIQAYESAGWAVSKVERESTTMEKKI